MGKRLIQQRRGRGTLTYRTPNHNYVAEVKHYALDTKGIVVDLVHCAAHSAPLIEVKYLTGDKNYALAPKGIKVGDEISIGNDEEIIVGNVLPLKNIPEGTLIHNIELRPGDGGKMVRSSGAFARIVARGEKEVRVILPSKREKKFTPECRAVIGVVAGGGRLEKPFLKAGNKYKKMRARNKLYPKVCGISMNAADHPYGGGCSTHLGRPSVSPRSAPPGRKVGKIAARRTGRKKR
jgi:large subunit ribosomal protein L2